MDGASTAQAHASLAKVSPLPLLEIIRARGDEDLDAAAALQEVGLHIATTLPRRGHRPPRGLLGAPRNHQGRP